jgi:hypothetical protein
LYAESLQSFVSYQRRFSAALRSRSVVKLTEASHVTPEADTDRQEFHQAIRKLAAADQHTLPKWANAIGAG